MIWIRTSVQYIYFTETITYNNFWYVVRLIFLIRQRHTEDLILRNYFEIFPQF